MNLPVPGGTILWRHRWPGMNVPAREEVLMAPRMPSAWCEVQSAGEVGRELVDLPFYMDEVAGDCFGSSAPTYAELPCYVPLDDEGDAFGPFSDSDGL